MLNRPLTARERHAIMDYCRVCGDLKLCDPGVETFLANRGLKHEDLKPNQNGTPRSRPGRVCIDCRRTAAKVYAEARGLKLTGRKGRPWFSKDGTRSLEFKGTVNAGKPLWHQLKKEQKPLADKMLEEYTKRYRERHGRMPCVRAKYLLVAAVIHVIKCPPDSLHINFVHEKRRLRKQAARVLFAKRNHPTPQHQNVFERVSVGNLQGI
jgi:hypothetical protein